LIEEKNSPPKKVLKNGDDYHWREFLRDKKELTPMKQGNRKFV